jgi:predicted lipoprotein
MCVCVLAISISILLLPTIPSQQNIALGSDTVANMKRAHTSIVREDFTEVVQRHKVSKKTANMKCALLNATKLKALRNSFTLIILT